MIILLHTRSYVQAAAAAQAGASVIQPNVGRLADYFRKNPGAVRDPEVQLLRPSIRARTRFNRRQSSSDRRSPSRHD